ncbi:MAG TPA: condensation domain-containing protein [Glycomyces sp.]|nr:condensation domain-containing protein [Glycomyces sp.]
MTGGTEPIPDRGAICWGQQWAWYEQRRPPERRSTGLLFDDTLVFPGLIVDRDDVRSAIRTLTERHQSLRSTFAVEDGRPTQLLWPADAELFELIDVGERIDGPEQPFAAIDIERRWPLRLLLGRSGRAASGLRVVVHHIAADRAGFHTFLGELRATVEAAARGAEPDLPPAGRQPLELAAFERSERGRAVNERAMRHWMSRRGELESVLGALRAGFDRPAPDMRVFRISSKAAAAAFDRLAATRRSSRAAVAVAAVSRALSGLLGVDTVPMYMLVNNRHLPGLRHSVASVVQAGLVAMDASADRRFEDAVPTAMRTIITAMRHAHYDGDDLTARTASFEGFEVDAAVSLPSVNFNFGDAPPPPGPAAAETRDDGAVLRWWTQDRPCLGMNFHFHSTETDLTAELRVGAHLLSEDGGRDLLTAVLSHSLETA